MKITRRSIKAAIDTGLEYWYYTKHGLGPGMIPPGVTVLDTYEEGWDTWVLLDKLLTTEDLKYYDLKEQQPPEGVTTHNGVVIEGATVEEIQKAIDERIAKQDAMGKQLDDLQENMKRRSGCFRKRKNVRSSDCNKVSEDNNDITYIVGMDDDTEEIEGMSLIHYGGYKIMPNSDAFCWEVLDSDNELVKSGFRSEFEAKKYISNNFKEGDIQGSEELDYDNIDVAKLKQDIANGCEEYLTGPEGGFLKSGSPKESRWDMYADEIYVVEVSKTEDYIEIEVRAELDYDGMSAMAEVLDKIIEKYDPDAYFEQAEPGIIDAYIHNNTDSINSSTQVTAMTRDELDRWNEGALSRARDRWLEPDDMEEYIPLEDLVSEFDFDIKVEVYEDDGRWYYVADSDPLEDAQLLEDKGVSYDAMLDDFNLMVEWYIPGDAGTYSIKGHAKLVYSTGSDIIDDEKYDINFGESSITDIDTRPIRKNEVGASSKHSRKSNIQAAMTEEELNQAIEEGEPFDLESFKEYKVDPYMEDSIQAQDVKVGDVIEIQEDASEVNLGTVVEILSINDPAEDWIDYTFQCEVVKDPGGMAGISKGSKITLHFDKDEYLGPLYSE